MKKTDIVIVDSGDDRHLLSLLRKSDTRSFETIYERFADRLYDYIYSRVRIREASEEIVQDIFLSLWKKRETVQITKSLELYLFGAAKFSILTYIRSERVRRRYAEDFALFSGHQLDNSAEEFINLHDLEQRINTSISDLPEKCRTAFILSRFDHKPIAQIAQHMSISPRTVENYLTRALRHLRTSMDHIPMLFPVLLLF